MSCNLTLSTFGRQSKQAVLVSNDNRIHLFESDTRKERRVYTEKNHLAHRYNCLDWNQSSPSSLGSLAVGCSSGTILVWDLTRGVISQTIGDNQSSPPTDVKFSRDSKSIFVSCLNPHISQYRVSDGELISQVKGGRKGTLKIAVNPIVDVIAVASNAVRLIDLSSGKKKKLQATFAGGVTGLEFTPCGCFIVCCGAGTREVLLFDVQAGAKSSLAPLCVVPTSGVPRRVSASSDQIAIRIDILCLFENADACVVRCQSSGDGLDEVTSFSEGSGETEGVMLVSTTEVDSRGSPVVCGSFIGAGAGEAQVSLCLWPKTQQLPSFERIEYENSDGDLVEACVVYLSGRDGHTDTSAVGGTKNGSARNNSGGSSSSDGEIIIPAAATVLGPFETGGKKRPIAAPAKTDDDDGRGNHKSRRLEETVAPDSSSKGAQNTDTELTLEERLETISASLVMPPAAGARNLGDKYESEALNADSLVTLVEQSLQSGDDVLLEQCLACVDFDTIDATAKGISVGKVVPFLRRLVAKFEKRPSRGSLLTQWLASLLRYHTSFLISVPDLSSQLAALSQMLEQRLSSYSSMAALGGRLDVIMNQMNVSSQDNGSSRNKVYGDKQQAERESVLKPKEIYYAD